MAQQKLQFIRNASAPATPVAGMIWFDQANHVIKVYTGSTWENYGGVMDASFKDDKLTITKANGTPVEIDFSDCASAEALGQLTTQVGTLEGTVNTHGNDISGLKTLTEQHTTALGTVDQRIADAVKAEADRAKGVEDGIIERVNGLETAKGEHDGKLSALETVVTETIPGQIEALEGADEALEARVKANEDKLAGVDVVKTYVDTTVGVVSEALAEETTRATGKEGELAGAIATEKGRIDTLIGAVEGDDAKSVRGIASEEVAKIVANADADYDTLKEIADWILAHPESVSALNSAISKNAEGIAANKGLIEAIQAAYVKSVADSADYLEVTTAEGVVTVKDAALKAELERLAGLIAENAEDIQEVNNKAGVTSFEGATGAITVDTTTDVNGTVKFAVSNNKLSGSVVGIKDAAYTTVAALEGTMDTKDAAVLASAKKYAEDEADAAETAAVNAAKAYTDQQITAAFMWGEF